MPQLGLQKICVFLFVPDDMQITGQKALFLRSSSIEPLSVCVSDLFSDEDKLSQLQYKELRLEESCLVFRNRLVCFFFPSPADSRGRLSCSSYEYTEVIDVSLCLSEVGSEKVRKIATRKAKLSFRLTQKLSSAKETAYT